MACSKCAALKKQLATLLTTEADTGSTSEVVLENIKKLKAAVKKARADKTAAVKNATLAVQKSEPYQIELYRWRGILGELSKHVDAEGKKIIEQLVNVYAAFKLPLPEEEDKCPCPCHSS